MKLNGCKVLEILACCQWKLLSLDSTGMSRANFRAYRGFRAISPISNLK
ncbi:hypothetical protein Goklo_019374 [Gossypium klotzschianum]|uniref:Uncharacterized protein n=1 Tax=Gossypium klotzschianum TaxID=34286 RepID=A0A7J8UNT9_9ROSI|nr:hypothetical protein [Gossypium klotzschianum]